MSGECGSLRVSASHLAHGYTGFHNEAVTHPYLSSVLYLFFVLMLHSKTGRWCMVALLGQLWLEDRGQDIAEYAVMLAVILVVVVGTLRLIGGNANNVFSATASSLGQ
jgi:Flp pilus assembly pilin Flp